METRGGHDLEHYNNHLFFMVAHLKSYDSEVASFSSCLVLCATLCEISIILVDMDAYIFKQRRGMGAASVFRRVKSKYLL